MTKAILAKRLSLSALLAALVLALFGCGTQTPHTAAVSPRNKAATAQTAQATTVSTATAASTAVTSKQTSAPAPAAKTPPPAVVTAAVPKSSTTPKSTPKPAAVSMSAAAGAGLSLYNAKCISCHAANGAGGSGPKLTGTLGGYATQSALAGFIQANMPLGQGNSLSASQTSDLATYLFYLNGK